MKHITRLTLCLAIALGFGMGGCDKDKPASGGGDSGKTLKIFHWSEYIPEEVMEGFTKETGIKVLSETYASNEQMLAKVMGGGGYDLIQPSEYTVEALIKKNKLAPIDPAKITNFKNLAPEVKNLAHDPGNKHSVPWMTGTVGIVYNAEKIKEPITGFKDVFQEKYKGRIVVVDDSREMVSWALATLSIPTNNITKENLEKTRPIIKAWVPLIKLYDSDSPKDKLKAGDVDFGIVWSGEAAKLIIDEPAKWKYVLPSEGAHMFLDSLAIPADAPNKEAAHKFIDYVLRPEVSKLISEKFPYTNPNLEARKLLSEKERTNPASYPQTAKLDIFRDIGHEMQKAIDEMVTEIKSK